MAYEIAVFDRKLIDEKNANLAAKAQALTVATASDLPAAQELLKGAQQWSRYIEDQRAIAKKPLLDQSRALDELAKEMQAPVAAATETIKAKILAYQDKLERERAARARALEGARALIARATTEGEISAALASVPFDDATLALSAETRRQEIRNGQRMAEEAAKLAEERRKQEEIRRKNGEEAAALAQARADADAARRAADEQARKAREAAESARLAKDAADAQARADALARAQSAKGIRTERLFEIVDAAALPREFLDPSESKIRAAVKAGREIPGVRTWEEKTVR